MFPSLPVAWSRVLLVVVLAAASSRAHEDSLYTASVTYCAPPQALLIQTFDVRYVRENASVVFDISAASVEKNLNVSANILLNVYGANSVNLTFDFCSIANGALCPLPTYNFNGSGTIPLSPYVDVAQHVPSIAYVIPDIEAYAQITLYRAGTDEVVACVQSTLSNGWSLRQSAVPLATGLLALFALLSALVHSRLSASSSSTSATSTPSHASHRFLQLIYFIQHICITGLLALNYSLAYRSFTLNFAWALGLIFIAPFQHAIDNLRHRTGGSLPDGALGAIDFTNRKDSPYNAAPPAGSKSFVATGPAVVTAMNQNELLPPGIPLYVNSLGISTQNAFLTVFFTVLLLIAAVGILHAVAAVALATVRRIRRDSTPEWVARQRDEYSMGVLRNAVRLSLVVILPVSVFAFFQWTFKDSWFATLFSVITLLVAFCGAAYSLALALVVSRGSNFVDRFRGSSQAEALGALYSSYRSPLWHSSALMLGAVVVKAAIVSFAKHHGLVQVIFLLLVEAVLLIALLILRPFKSRASHAFGIFLSLARLATTALLVPFVQRLHVRPIPRAAIGIVSAVVSSVAIVVLFVSIVINAGWGVLWPTARWRALRTRASGSGDGSSRGARTPTMTQADLPPRPNPPEPLSQLPSAGPSPAASETTFTISSRRASSVSASWPPSPDPLHTPSASRQHSPLPPPSPSLLESQAHATHGHSS